MKQFSRLLAIGAIGTCGLAGCNDYVTCESATAFDGDAVKIEWGWRGGPVNAAPVVADIDGDGAPEVVVNVLGEDGGEDIPGFVTVLDGATGHEKWRIPHAPEQSRFGTKVRAGLALADVSGDGLPDIIYAGLAEPGTKLSAIHAVDGFGELLWTSRLPSGLEVRITVENGAPAVANLDDDPEAEIVVGATVIDHDGVVVWNEDGDGGDFGAPKKDDGVAPYGGALSTVADLDGDGRPEIISGRDAWAIDWSGGPEAVDVKLLWKNSSGGGNDGWPAVADLDGNGTPEVVLTAWGEIRVLDGRTGQLWCGRDPSGEACEADPGKRTQPVVVEGGHFGGPPTIADFDGDGRPEVAVAGGTAFAVYDFNRPEERLGDSRPAPGAGFVRWSAPTRDNTSGSTASSAFDFDGDGRFELLYQDECYFRVFDAASGAVLLERPNSNGTIHEYPVVVDVDADEQSEILVVAAFVSHIPSISCEPGTSEWFERQGVYAYGPGAQTWVPARPVWTQHTQHGTDVDASGNVPRDEQDHWRVNNSFRAALPAEGAALPASDDGAEVCP